MATVVATTRPPSINRMPSMSSSMPPSHTISQRQSDTRAPPYQPQFSPNAHHTPSSSAQQLPPLSTYQSGVLPSSNVSTPQKQRNQMSFDQNSAGASFATMQNSFSGGMTHIHSDATEAIVQIHPHLGIPFILYSALYSNIPVFELFIDGHYIMRRSADSWLNATQILKCASLEKGKRTKVLEKEILPGEHEKVQGGYGRYQGTWIRYERGRQFCNQYRVDQLLAPLLSWGEHDVPPNVPSKEQAMAAWRKWQMFNGNGKPGSQNNTPSKGTFFKSISKDAASAIQAMTKARFDSPPSRPMNDQRRPIAPMVPQSFSQSTHYHQDSSAPNTQQTMQSSQTFSMASQIDPNLEGMSFTGTKRPADYATDGRENKRQRLSHAVSFMSAATDPYSQQWDTEDLATLPDTSFSYRNHQPSQSQSQIRTSSSSFFSRAAMVGTAPLPYLDTDDFKANDRNIKNFMIEPEQADFTNHPFFELTNGEALDQPFDNKANTLLHWAASTGKPARVRALVAHGANIARLTLNGETPLMWAAITINNATNRTFPEILDVLGASLSSRDGHGRTVLHHIVMTSASKSVEVCRYYMNSLLEYVVRQGTNPVPTATSNGVHAAEQQPLKPMGLAQFMSEIVNARDIQGDTALNMAARMGNKAVIQQLLEVGANPTIHNKGGLNAIDFGVAAVPEEMTAMADPVNDGAETNGVEEITDSSQRSTRLADSKMDLTEAIKEHVQSVGSTLASELAAKQALIETANAKLRETIAKIKEESTSLQDLQEIAIQRKHMRDSTRVMRAQVKIVKAAMFADEVPYEERATIKFGAADGEMTVLKSFLPSATSPSDELAPRQLEYLDSLPSAQIMRARIAAYRTNNTNLRGTLRRLKGQSVSLDEKLRKLVCLATHIKPSKPTLRGTDLGLTMSTDADIDASTEDKVMERAVEGLLDAVESETLDHVEDGKVREFLRRVEIEDEA